MEMGIYEANYNDKVNEVYPSVGEELVDVLNKCKLKGSEVMMCPKCSIVFDEKATEGFERNNPQISRGDKWPQSRPNYAFNKRDVPYRA